MTTKPQEFIFEHFDWEPETKTFSGYYQLGNLSFCEQYIFDFAWTENIDKEALEKAFEGLWIMAGISYYKTFCPEKIIIKNTQLSVDQAEFFEKTYRYGLGEFCYQNQIPLLNPKFPKSEVEAAPGDKDLEPSAIVPLGGGKDSLTTVELFTKAKIPFVTWTVGDYSGLESTLKIIREENPKHKHFTVHRKVDQKIIQCNQDGAYNGHVPISAIWAFTSVCTALLSGKKYLAFSNENSANEGTTTYEGVEINHQYSKTLDFEVDFQKYVKNNIHTKLEYFSALRPLEELHIAKIFAEKSWPKHAKYFSSCNRNFHLNQDQKNFFWCGKCPKCAFVFTILAPFVAKEELIEVFGKNCFTDSELKTIFSELLGNTKNKPFDCVGSINEVRTALQMASKKFPEIKDLALQNLPEAHYNFKDLAPHQIPNFIWEKIYPLDASDA